MKLREKMKRFWTLDVHNHEGFTLVELIIVIAILAILSTGAIAGYSVYVEQANRTKDEALAAEIKNAMILAAYSGTLKPGASVVVYFDNDKDAVVDASGDLGADKAMIDAFGANYKTALHLSWNGWKNQMGVVADSTMMGYVNGSNFKPENLDTMLGHVGTVVDAATAYVVGNSFTPSEEQLKYLQSAGVATNGVIETEDQAKAVANATVFCVADVVASLDLSDENRKNAYLDAWFTNNFSNLGWEPIVQEAASYAMVLAVATYVDANAGTTFCSQLGGGANEILSNRSNVFGAIAASTDPAVQTALSTYIANDYSSLMAKDAMAFAAYMQGVSSSSDSMIKNSSLTNGDFFTDGTVLSYVNNYVSLGNVMPSDATNGAFVFYFDGTTVACLPLDY